MGFIPAVSFISYSEIRFFPLTLSTKIYVSSYFVSGFPRWQLNLQRISKTRGSHQSTTTRFPLCLITDSMPISFCWNTEIVSPQPIVMRGSE